MDGLEARDLFTQPTLVLPCRILGKDNDEIHVGDTREVASRRTAEQDHAHQRMPELRARRYDRVKVGLDAGRKLKARRRVRAR